MGLIDLKHRLIIAHSIDDLSHELAHVICGPVHSKEFSDIYHELGGKELIFNSILDKLLLRLGLAANVGNVTGVQNLLVDYHLLQAYRKFSQRVLATEGQWEIGGDQKIKLYPTPRGAFPVVVKYIPVVNRFKTPESKEVTKRMLVAEAKIILGNARSKINGIPTPDGGTLNLNGDALRTEGMEEKKQALEDAILLGRPLPIVLW